MYVTKRYQVIRDITNTGDLRECQSFVVHRELRRLLRHQTAKNVFEAYARIFVYVNAVTPVSCVGCR